MSLIELKEAAANRQTNISRGDKARRAVAEWLRSKTGITESGARQLAEYFVATYRILGAIPSQKKIILERFFDESGGMQLVIHSPFGIRLNRAWGLALRKRFCRSFNFELQAAATDDAIVLSLGTQHSFPLEDVFKYLHSNTVRDLLVQALLDAPMFPTRWRWNATRALALPRQRGGRKVPAPLQRMEAENLLAAVFPDQLACLENIAGDREIPEHPLVQQTIGDCLTEAMDVEGLVELLRKIENGEIECIARDLPEPSPLAQEILHARPYAFLDNAPLEERRTQAVYTRRAGDSGADSGLGILDSAAIENVCAEAWPQAENADELHEALLLAGLLTQEEIARVAQETRRGDSSDLVRAELSQTSEENQPAAWLGSLIEQGRVGLMTLKTGDDAAERRFWVAAERIPMIQAVYPDLSTEPPLQAPLSERARQWARADAIRELVRGRLEISGPVTGSMLKDFFALPGTEIEAALLALEAEGFVLRGQFHAPSLNRQASDGEAATKSPEWCARRLLARIHRLTINRLRAEIQPVAIADFQRFLTAWQRVDAEHRAQGPDGLEAVLDLLDGYEAPAAAWEPEILAVRLSEYWPEWLDRLCFRGCICWGRLTAPQNPNGRLASPVRSSPLSLFARENQAQWLQLSAPPLGADFSPDTRQVREALTREGALFFGELVQKTGLLASRVELALAELTAQGWVTADSFEGLRALLVPQEKRMPFGDLGRKRRFKAITSIAQAGRWSLLRRPANGHLPTSASQAGGSFERGSHDTRRLADGRSSGSARDRAVETFARVFLRRYGVAFRRMLERESLNVSWYELVRVYRQLEARGEIRGGYFVGGVSGEQFALPEAIGLLRSTRKSPPKNELIVLSGADPLNLAGILTPGARVAALASTRLLLCDGVPIAVLEGGQVTRLSSETVVPDEAIDRALRVGEMAPALRPYYA